MDKETKDIIKLIAGIQIESLTSIKKELVEKECLEDFYSLLRNLLEISEEDILISLDKHIQLYIDIESVPGLINILSEYQMMICSHILFRMEDEWLQTNSQGVMGCWELFRKAQLKFHPELTLLKI